MEMGNVGHIFIESFSYSDSGSADTGNGDGNINIYKDEKKVTFEENTVKVEGKRLSPRKPFTKKLDRKVKKELRNHLSGWEA